MIQVLGLVIAHLLYQKTNCNHLSIIISTYYLVDRLHLLFTVLTYISKSFLIPSPPVLLQSTHLDNILHCLWGKTSKKEAASVTASTAFTPYDDELNLKPPGEAVGAPDYIFSPWGNLALRIDF